MGDIPIHKITAFQTVEALKPVAASGKLETVRRLCQRLNEVMIYAANTGLIDHNLLFGIKAAFVKPEKNHLPTLAPERLTDFLRDLYNASIRVTTRQLILWQLHTMTRPAEASGTCWNEINWQEKIWVIPAERMKKKRAHKIPLTVESLEILTGMKAISSESEFVFPGDRSFKTPVHPQTANMAIKRMGYKGELVAHGLRSLASTILNDKGFDPDIIEACLAHVDRNTVRAVYNRADYLERKREMLSWWSAHINEALRQSFSVRNHEPSAISTIL